MNKQSLITILLTVLLSMTDAKTFAHDIAVANDDGVTIYYVWTNNKTELAVSNGSYTGNVVIPKSVDYNGNTYPVTSIGNSAFQHCGNLTSVTIPNSVISIGNSAFLWCSGQASVTIPNSVTSIGNSAFQYCSGLTSVTIPYSVTSIGEKAFYDCGLTSVTVNGCLTTIGSKPFSDCPIKEVSFDCEIVPSLFRNLGIKKVSLSENVKTIGEQAFSGCSGLTSFTIPNSVTSIGNYAFQYCSGLTSITIPNSVTSIGDCAFCECSGLTSITIPNSVTSIGESAFSDCTGLTSVIFGNSVKSIGNGAFYRCSGLTSVTIPNSVTSIGRDAFRYCSGLTSVTIGNSVTSIGEHAFFYCTGLTSVTIPNSVTSIGSEAFYGCSGLATIISEIKSPFRTNITDTDRSITLIVPAGTKKAYKNTGWGLLKIVEVGEGGVVGSIFVIDRIYYTIGMNNIASLTSANKAISGALVIPSQVDFNGKKYDVTSIGKSAFYNCSGLTSVTIPNSVTSIGDYGFYKCTALVQIISKAKAAPTCGFVALEGINKLECKLIVPKGYMSVYQSADQWKDFFFMEEGEYTPEQPISGDVNGDGKVDENDVKDVSNYIMGKSVANFIFDNADINKDGKVNAADIVAIVNKIINLNPTPDPTPNPNPNTNTNYFWMGTYWPTSNTFPTLNGKEVEGIVTTYTSLDDAMSKASRNYSSGEYGVVMYPSSWGAKSDLVFWDSANKKYYALKKKDLADFPDYTYYETTLKIGANARLTLATETAVKAAGGALYEEPVPTPTPPGPDPTPVPIP